MMITTCNVTQREAPPTRVEFGITHGKKLILSNRWHVKNISDKETTVSQYFLGIKHLNRKLYLQRYIPQAPPCLSTTYADYMLVTTPTDDIIPSIHVIGSSVILRASCRGYLKIQVKSPINCQKLSNLTSSTS